MQGDLAAGSGLGGIALILQDVVVDFALTLLVVNYQDTSRGH
jgi:hypothetical protein